MRLRPRLHPWMLVSAVWIAPAVLATIGRVAEQRMNGEPPASAPDLLWAGGDWLVYAVMTPPIFAAVRRWPIARPHVARRALLHLLFALLFCLGWATLGKLLEVALALVFKHDEAMALLGTGSRFWLQFGRNLAGWIFVTLPFGVIVYLSIAAIAHAIRYFFEATDRELQLARVSEQLASTRLAALQAQLNPHFLFNSLNTIAVLVRGGENQPATRVIEQLSDVLRSTLDGTQASEVTLDDELELVRQYLAVEEARFSDRLRPVLDIEPAALPAAIPRFALQHLVENALRHGIAKRTDAGRVTIAARRAGGDLEISVEDDGPGISGSAAAPGHGLENTRERLRTLYGERASLEVVRAGDRGTVARLRIPFRELARDTAPDDRS
ncbi:MAG TPA: histidine kinase [Vicinamibacterales bacterium]|nr:histidine kinase [Vicinamibacterales bacterium]